MTEKIDILEPSGKRKKKIVEHNEYSSWLTKIFRKENWVRGIGILVMYKSNSFPVSTVKIFDAEFSSVLGLFVLGILIAIGGPELLSWVLSKFPKNGSPENETLPPNQ